MKFDIESIHRALIPDFGMRWNVLLALVPVAMSCWLFRVGRRPGWLWWPGLIVFCLFLPNAAYTLTDVIHLIYHIRREPYDPVWTVSLVLMPQYALFMLLGLQSHVLSLMWFGDYLRWLGKRWMVVPMELTLNFAAALGIYLGRFQRFNSWDVAEPKKLALETIHDLTRKYPLEIIAVTFAILTALYYIFKLIDRAVIETWFRRAQPATTP